MINLRPYDSDMSVLRQVFVENHYDLNKLVQMTRIRSAYASMLRAGRCPVIIDAGANIGASSIYFAKMFPDAKIVAVEPDPQNAEICRRNCESVGNITVVEAAIGATPGKVKLNRPGKTAWAVRTERGEGADIRVVTVDELLDEASLGGNLFIIKIDIEGFENDLFSSDTSWLSEATVVIIELHDWMLPGQYSSLPFQRAMLSLNSEVLISGENLIFVR
jgi:methyltransferase, FkbM family